MGIPTLQGQHLVFHVWIWDDLIPACGHIPYDSCNREGRKKDKAVSKAGDMRPRHYKSVHCR